MGFWAKGAALQLTDRGICELGPLELMERSTGVHTWRATLSHLVTKRDQFGSDYPHYQNPLVNKEVSSEEASVLMDTSVSVGFVQEWMRGELRKS